MIYSSSVFKNKLGLVSLVVLASLLSSTQSYAMDNEKKPDVSSTSAITDLQKAAEEGDKEALHRLACCYMSGQGVEKDYEKAHDLFERAADKGNLNSLHALGSMYRDGVGVEKDEYQARELFKKGAKKGHADCQYALGVEDIEQEIQCFKLAANQGYVRAAFELAWIYHDTSCTGRHYNITKNNQKAFNYLKSIVDRDKNFLANLRKDYVLPKLFLSMMYFSGQGTLQNGEEGLKYYNSATDSKNGSAAVAGAYDWLLALTGYTSIPAANYIKGLMCREGRGTEQNYFEAAKNFGAAAKKGFLLAEEALDNACQLASQQGDAKSLYELGELYDGRAPEKALKYYTLAADKGWLPAQAKMAEMYCNGIGTVCDYTKAQKYVDMAAATYKDFEETHSRAKESFHQYELLHEHEFLIIKQTTQSTTRQMFPEEIKLLEEYNRLSTIRGEFSKAHTSTKTTLGQIHYNRVLSNLSQVQTAPNDQFKDAIIYYTAAAEDNDPIAQYNLATMYYNGEGTPQNFQLAFQWHKCAAKQNNPHAQHALFNMFFTNQGVPDDFILSDLKKLTKTNAQVQLNFGNMFYYAQGFPRNHITAYKYFARAVKLGYSNPLPLAPGITLDRFRDGLLRQLKLKIEDSDINAQYAFGDLSYFLCKQKINDYTFHEECKNLYKQAIDYLTLAADRGNALAQKKLGSLYDKTYLDRTFSLLGNDLTFEVQEALVLKYWKLAADQGIIVPKYSLRHEPFEAIALYCKQLTEEFKKFKNPQFSIEENVKNFKKQQPSSANKLAFLKKLVTFVKTTDTVEEATEQTNSVSSANSSASNPHETKEFLEEDLYPFFAKTSILTNKMFFKSDHHSPTSGFKKPPFVMEELHPLYLELGKFGQDMDELACDIQKNLKTPGFMITAMQLRYDMIDADGNGSKKQCGFLESGEKGLLYCCIGDPAVLGYKFRSLLEKKDEIHENLDQVEILLKVAKARTHWSQAQYAQICKESDLIPRARQAIDEGFKDLTALSKIHLSARNQAAEKEYELFFH